MSEPEPREAHADLAAQLADAVAGVPGVSRLEPTLTSSLRRLRTRAVAGAVGADGITVHDPGPDGPVVVTVDLTVTGPRPSRLVARDVRREVLDVLARRGREAGDIRVTVLGVDAGPS